MGVAYGDYCVLQANRLKPDLCEQSNCRDEPQVVFHAVPFIEERSLVREEQVYLSRNRCCSFWYDLGVCGQHRSRWDFI
jgi:hypothetical protein